MDNNKSNQNTLKTQCFMCEGTGKNKITGKEKEKCQHCKGTGYK